MTAASLCEFKVQASSTTLLLDLGNTRLKTAVWNGAEMQFLGACNHQDETSLLAWFDTTLGQLPGPPVHAYGVSVAHPDIMNRLELALKRRHATLQLHWIWPEASTLGLTNTYPNPRQLGADRWAGMLGLMSRFANLDRSIVLANFGTATTVDTLSRDKRFLGGLILPGVSMMQNALSTGTARLPLADGKVQDHPDNTHSAITTGIVAAQLGAIRRQLELSAQRDDKAPLLCVSGGAWDLLRHTSQSMLTGVDILELPHIVLDGVCHVASHARPAP